MRTDVNYIQAAYAGRCDMWRSIIGGKDEPEKESVKVDLRPSKDRILNFARTHNALLKAGKMKKVH